MTDEDKDAPRKEAAPPPPPFKYVPAFFIDLAAKGKEAWNTWRMRPRMPASL